MNFTTLAIASALLAALSAPAFANQTCELNGESINPNNGNTTQGKTGLMRCRDTDTGMVVREQELQHGKFMGVLRYFKEGQLEREYSVNERGNREGRSREWNLADGKRVLVREETYVNSKNIGVVRTWYPTGQKRRLGFFGDDDTEQASVEFTPEGKLSDLRCAPRPVFGSEFDDKAACGHGGSVSTVEFFGAKGVPTSRVAFERGERRKREMLWDNGGVRELREASSSGGLERRFAADGTKLRERQWVTTALPGSTAAKPPTRSVDTLDQEFHETGKLIHERKWQPTERGADLLSESHWYLNGQLKDRSEFGTADGKRVRRDTSFFDNGKRASEGSWLLADSKFSRDDFRATPFGTHKSFDEQGRPQTERLFDDRGRLTRERVFDERGTPVRDDEVFEDGSRKSVGK